MDRLNTQGGHIAILLALVLMGMLGSYLKLDGGKDMLTLSLGGLLVELAVRGRE